MSAVSPPPVDLIRETSLPELAAQGPTPARRGDPRATLDRRGRGTPLVPLLAFGALTALAAGIGARVTASRRTFAWYHALAKPSFTPPDRAFGLVWPVLYGLTAASAARVWRARHAPEGKRALALWSAQLLLNAAWTPIFFGARRPGAALADLAATFLAAAEYARAAAKVDRGATWLVLPYVSWLAFAGAVNTGVVIENRDR